MAPLSMRIDEVKSAKYFSPRASGAYLALIAIKFLDGSKAGVIGFS